MPSIGGRLRSKGSLTTKVSCDVRSYPISCANRTPTVYTTYYSQPVFGVKDTMYDEVDPLYWKARSMGKFVQTNELHQNTIIRESYGNTDIRQTAQTPYVCTPPQTEKPWAEYKGKFVATFHWSGFLGGNLLSSERMDNLRKQVVTECMANRQKGESNYFESLGELDQTYAMLRSPLENVNEYLDNFVRDSRYKRIQDLRRKIGKSNVAYWTWKGRKYLRSDFLRLVSGEWLRFRYGISPLISDVKAAVKVLGETFDIKDKLHTARSSAQIYDTNIIEGNVADAYARVDYLTTQSHTYKVRAWWHDTYQSTPFDKLGLTYQNVVGAAWEFTRLSFVVDWFVNVSGIIYGNIPRVDVNSLGGGFSLRNDIHQVYFPIGYTNLQPSLYIITGTIGDGVKESKSYTDRYPMSGQTYLVFKDDFRLDNWKRAADAVTLIKMQLGRMRF